MGDRRFAPFYGKIRHAEDKAQQLRSMRLDEIVAALAEASRYADAYMANVLATEAQNRIRQKQSLLASVPEALIGVDAGLHVTFANEEGAELFGAVRGDRLPESEAAVALRRAIETQERVERTVHLDDKSLHLLAAPIARDDEAPTGATLVARDVTGALAAQDQLRVFNEALEERVRDRTSQLAVHMTELEAFSYTVSHDLRAPLRGIETYAEILLADHGDALPEDARDLVGRIHADARRTTRLIQDLLQLARVGRGEIDRRRFDLSEVARVAVEAVCARRGQHVECRVQPGMAAEGDPQLVSIVLENLVSNAVKFSGRAEHPCVEVGEREGWFFVHDNGVGFPPGASSRLFRPFQRLHTGEGFEGTGIGLATVARIVERHGGQVRAESEPGKGATFYFSLGEHTNGRTREPG